MSLENVPSAIPDVLDYTKVLPLAIESRARRRTYLASNGQQWISDQQNIIRIPIVASAFLDTKESYLRFRLTNSCGVDLGLDYGGGHSVIDRLTITQGGRILSDVHNYNRLLSAILLPVQADESNLGARSIKDGMRYANSAVGGAGNIAPATTGEMSGAVVNTPTNANDVVLAGATYTFCIPLINGLLGTSQDKLVPLQLLGSQPLQIEITLANANDIGVFNGAAAPQPLGYTIDDVRYCASLVEVGPEVDQHLREVQGASGGRLTLPGSDYTHYGANTPPNSVGLQSLNIPSRRKSIKSILWAVESQTYGAAPLQSTFYNLSYGGHVNCRSFQLRLGNRNHPETPVDCFFSDIGPAFNGQTRAQCAEELAKCFGSASDPHGTGVLSRINYLTQNGQVAGGAGAAMALESAGAAPVVSHQFGAYGLDIEAFQPDGKGGGALESGIDTASTSTPLALVLDIGAAQAINLKVDVFVVHDSIYFIDMVGNLRVAL